MPTLKTKLYELRKERSMQQAELAMDIAKVFDKTVEEIFIFKDDEED